MLVELPDVEVVLVDVDAVLVLLMLVDVGKVLLLAVLVDEVLELIVHPSTWYKSWYSTRWCTSTSPH